MFRIEWLGRTIIGGIGHQLMPPVITTGLHVDRSSGAFVNDNILHCRTRLQRFFYCREQLDFIAPTERTVLCNDDRGLTIVNAIHQSVCREAAEDDRVRCADTRAKAAPAPLASEISARVRTRPRSDRTRGRIRPPPRESPPLSACRSAPAARPALAQSPATAPPRRNVESLIRRTLPTNGAAGPNDHVGLARSGSRGSRPRPPGRSKWLDSDPQRSSRRPPQPSR